MEDDGKPHTIKLCRNCYDLRVVERNESEVTTARRNAMTSEKSARGELSAAFGTDGFVKRMWERYAVFKDGQDNWRRQRRRCS